MSLFPAEPALALTLVLMVSMARGLRRERLLFLECMPLL